VLTLKPLSYLRRRKLLKALRTVVKTASKLLSKSLDVKAAHQTELQAAKTHGQSLLEKGETDLDALESAADRLTAAIYDSSFSRHVLPLGLKSFLELLVLLLAALTIRAFLYEPFKIPTGSMKPTLLHGDHVFIRKFHYGPRWPFTTDRIWQGQAPARGDIAVFNFPLDPSVDYIKRIVAVEGDRVKVVDGHLFVNGQPQSRRSLGKHTFLATDERTLQGSPRQADLYQEQSGEAAHYSLLGPQGEAFYNQWPEYYFQQPQKELGALFSDRSRGLACRSDSCEVLPGFVFTMGDNRDGSSDSRLWGGVPVEYLRGKATLIWFSHDWTEPVLPLGPLTIGRLRWKRMFRYVDDLGSDLSAPSERL